jgi:hypothetical protein
MIYRLFTRKTFVQVLSGLVGALLITQGLVGLASAQDDDCGLIIRRNPHYPAQVYQFGCPDTPCPSSAPPTCIGGTYTDSYGNPWMVCYCFGFAGDICLEAFLPHDLEDEDGTGNAQCFPSPCSGTCYWDWIVEGLNERYACVCTS